MTGKEIERSATTKILPADFAHGRRLEGGAVEFSLPNQEKVIVRKPEEQIVLEALIANYGVKRIDHTDVSSVRMRYLPSVVHSLRDSFEKAKAHWKITSEKPRAHEQGQRSSYGLEEKLDSGKENERDVKVSFDPRKTQGMFGSGRIKTYDKDGSLTERAKQNFIIDLATKLLARLINKQFVSKQRLNIVELVQKTLEANHLKLSSVMEFEENSVLTYEKLRALIIELVEKKIKNVCLKAQNKERLSEKEGIILTHCADLISKEYSLESAIAAISDFFPNERN